jgi:hypothetical protein
MIYDPITRQEVTILGRYPPQKFCWRFGAKQTGLFHFVRVRYGEHLQNFRGGFPVGTERDVDQNDLVADFGAVEIAGVVEAAPLLGQNDAGATSADAVLCPVCQRRGTPSDGKAKLKGPKRKGRAVLLPPGKEQLGPLSSLGDRLGDGRFPARLGVHVRDLGWLHFGPGLRCSRIGGGGWSRSFRSCSSRVFWTLRALFVVPSPEVIHVHPFAPEPYYVLDLGRWLLDLGRHRGRGIIGPGRSGDRQSQEEKGGEDRQVAFHDFPLRDQSTSTCWR